MFDNLINSNIYKYGGDIKEITFIDNDKLFAFVHPMYQAACFITDVKNKINTKILKEDFNIIKYKNDLIYYLKPFDDNIYEYNFINKQTKIYDLYQSNDNFFDLNNTKKDPIQALLRSPLHYQNFKDDFVVTFGFSYSYKKANIVLASTGDGFKSSPNFTAQEFSTDKDYLAVSTTYYTKYDVNPKVKLFKINENEDDWILVSELKYDFFVYKLKILNGFIYFIDRKNNFVIADYQSNILKIIPLKKDVLCFDISPDNKKLAFAYGQYIKIIDI